MPTDKETDWIYRESTKKLLMRLLLAGCAISVLLEFVLGGRKGKFDVDGIPGFYALLGFVSCTLMIFAAKGLGLWLKVPTNFYEQEKTDDNNPPPTLIRNISLLAILIGFFLPWLDLGEMGELMSGFAAMAGEKIPSTLSGFQLASDGPGGSFGDGPSPALYGVIPFALIAAFYNKTWTAIVCTILAIGIIVLFAPTVNEMGKAAGASGWGIGKVITMIGFVVIVLTRASGGVEDTA